MEEAPVSNPRFLQRRLVSPVLFNALLSYISIRLDKLGH